MHFLSERRPDPGLVERAFTLADIPGFLWMPASAKTWAPLPLVLLAHPGGLGPMYPRLLARARATADLGFSAVTIELPSNGDRPRIPAIEQARAAVRETVTAGGLPGDDVIDSFILPLVDLAVPEWQAVLDALLELPEFGGPVGYSGGVIAIGTRLANVESRVVAAGLFAGSYIPRSIVEEARHVTIPLHVLLQWDDEGNDRQRALELFDAFGSAEKTLQANLGGHTGVPSFAGEDAARFFFRHLKYSEA
ncbi:alpha/beta hydrolase [Nocardia yunnanensis]|uniref:Alpha/beta hydrolase n=1 Tax=Nocardia yunnanensis TaxID=2382165 RepID=A0A386ZEE0_9NOCA|nr:alpha/beta hydrolase [Nocardia yunnanensis]AYF75896.1 alpha/beta hydrolase [Nocardia yunnanensis]